MNELREKLHEELLEAEHKAWDSLARYKFMMFGYWAAVWVHTNRVGDFKLPNPWSELVKGAKAKAVAAEAALDAAIHAAMVAGFENYHAEVEAEALACSG